MSLPIRHLPVLQNWDCHVCGTCCQEYQVQVSDDERKRIESQNWDRDRDLGGHEPFVRRGPFWARHTTLNHRPDGSCVFLSDRGRCRIHEKFGYEAKPLPCRLFPFVLIPAGDHWKVGVRYACPSAAGNKGRPMPEHLADLRAFAALLAEREGIAPRPDGTLNAPPWVEGLRGPTWADVERMTDVLLRLLRNRRDPVERRLRKCLHFAAEVRQLRLNDVDAARRGELFDVMGGVADAETPADPLSLPKPGWVGRVLFRQAAAVLTRKDHGPNRGPDIRNRLSLIGAAIRFARGGGRVPRLHGVLPEATFAQAEEPRGPLPEAAERLLERYYLMKVGSTQFFGAAMFGLRFWEGFELLALTLPVILWTSRLFRDVPREQAVETALTVVDDHISFKRILATLRQRVSFRILSSTGELARLIAWYSR